MFKGLLFYNGFYFSSSFQTLVNEFLHSAEQENMYLEAVNSSTLCPFDVNALPFFPDFVLFFDKDVQLLKQLEQAGIRTFNCAKSIYLCDDKQRTYVHLKGICPMPITVLSPLTFYQYSDFEFLKRVENVLSYPYVVKEGSGSFGQQVYLVHNFEEVKALVKALAPKPLVFQEYIEECKGQDVRMYFVKDKLVSAIRRQNLSGDFRANIENGGEATPYTPTEAEIEIGKNAMRALSLTFGGVDILQAHRGPLLLEVNSNAHFSALKRVTGQNPAIFILREIQKQCRG